MKKVGYIILVFVLMLTALSGCQSTNQTSSVKSSSQAQPEVVNYFTWRVNAGKYPDLLVAAFKKKYPNIKVNVTPFGTDVQGYLNAQKVRLLANDNMDVTSIRPESLHDYVSAGYLLDLTGQSFLKNYNQSALDTVKVNGKQYGVPSSENIIGVYYNKKIFSDLNLSVPQNFDEFLAACDKIKAAGIIPMENGAKDGWPTEFDVYPYFQQLLVKNPDIFTHIADGKAKYTDSNFVDVFNNINNFYKKGYIGSDTLSMGYDGASTLFRQGKTAMMIQGEWNMTNFSDKLAPSFDVGVFPLPYNAAGEDIVVPVTVGVTEAIVASSKNKDAALKFVDYMSTVEGATIISKNLACFVPVTGVSTDFNPLAKLWTSMLSMKSCDFFYNLQSPAANSAMIKDLQLMFLGKMTPSDAAKDVQTAQDSVTK